MPLKPDLVFHTAPIDVETDHSAFTVQLSPSKPTQDLSHTNRPSAPIIEDWVSDSEDESETNYPLSVPSFVQSFKQVKTPIHSVQPVEAPILDDILKPTSPKLNSSSKRRNRKTCFVCRSVDHLIKDCDYHAKKKAQPTPRNYANGVCAVVSKIMVTRPRHAHLIDTKSNSPIRRHITRSLSLKISNSPPRVIAAQASVVSAAMGKKGKWGNPQYALKDKGVIDSGYSRHMTWNMSYLSDFEELNGGYVAFGGNPKGGKISGKGKIKTGKLDFKDVYFVKELKFNLFNVSQMCGKKNSVLFTDTKCLVLSLDFKLPDESQVLLRGPRENNMLHMDLYGPTFIKSLNKKSYCLVITDDYSRFTWVFFLAIKDETSPILKTFITGLENKLSIKVKVTRSDNETEFKNSDINQFRRLKGIKKEFSVPRTPQQNGIVERKNRILIEAARTMLADSLLPVSFWAEAINNACYVQNRVLVTKPHNKTPYELLHGSGPTWLFDIDSLTRTMNYQPVTAGNQSNPSVGFQDKFDAEKAGEEVTQQYMLFPVWSSGSSNPHNKDRDAAFDGKEHEVDTKKPESAVNVSPSSRNKDLSADHSDNSSNDVNAAGSIIPTAGQNSSNSTNLFSVAGPLNTTASPTRRKSSFKDASQLPDIPDMLEMKDITYSYHENVGAEADFNNLETSITSAFLYGTIEEEVYVCQPPGFEDPDHPDKVYKVVKALYGLHQAHRAWYETLANYFLENGFHKGKIDQTLFIKKQKGEILLVQIYVDDIIFGATKKDLCKSFKKLMKDKFQMSSMGELTFFFGLQVKQKKDGIFISQDKYVAEILKKFGLTKGKSASTPIDTDKPLLKDPDDSPFDLVAYSDNDYAGASLDKKSTTEGCQFLGCRMISWQCKKQTVVATSSTEAEYVAAASCCTQSNDVTRLQALVDRKKVVITEAAIRDVLRLDDANGVDCLPNEEIFAELARMGYENSSTKLIFYKAFFSSQWKFLIHTILQSISVKRTTWNEFSSAMASDVICLSTGADIAVSRDDVQDQSISSPTPLTPPPPTTLRSSIHITVAQALEITKLKKRVKKLERANKVKVLKLRRLKKVRTSQRIKSSADIDMEDASNQGRMIDDLDRDLGEDEPKVQEVVEVVTTAKLITEVVVAVSESVTTASATSAVVPAATITAAPSKDKGKGIMVEEPKPMRKKQQVEMDKEYARKLHEELNKDIDWSVAIDHVKQKDKEDSYVQRYQGMSYDDIRPIFEAKFNSNIEFLLKSKEQLEEEENRAIKSINETTAQKAAKRRKLNEEVEDLKQYLEIVPDEDDYVYTEATPLARKVPIVDYQIIQLNNKPHYKIIRADGTHQLVGKGFSRVETPLFKGMLVAQQVMVVKEGYTKVHVEEVNAGDAAEGDVTLSRRVEHLEFDKIAQALEITKLKRRVKKLERSNKVKVLKLRRLHKVGTKQRVETSDETVMDDVFKQGRMIAEMDQDADEDESEPAEVQKVIEVVTTAKIITEVVTTASETITAASETLTAAEAQVPAATFIAAPARVVASPSRRRKGVVIRDHQEESTTSTIIPTKTKSIDKAINHVNKKAKEDNAIKRYQAMKRKPQAEAQARKNMMVYLKNVAGFKMDYFKGMSSDDIRPIFERYFDLNVAFLQKTKEQIEEEESRALKRLNETLAEKAAKRQKLDEEVEEHKRHLKIVPKEDLETLWSLVKERFATTKPKNFSDDFLLVTLEAMFEKPDIHAQIWKIQRSVHGPAKVKGWKLLESCGV
nr:ribonuclease H-like domain, reverse transcriptase, RNA-dependent DNA polymerase [Tanacetum cinerariifolium]